MRIYKFAERRVAKNATMQYQSFTGYTVKVDGRHVGRVDRMVANGTMWEINLSGRDYAIRYSFLEAKAALREMLAKHYPVAT